jgi:hypothetical protein
MIIAASGVAGFLTPFLVPTDWLKHVFWANLITSLVFAVKCVDEAERDKEARDIGPLLGSLLGVRRPTGKIRDWGALLGFISTLTFMAGLAVGAFAVIR